MGISTGLFQTIERFLIDNAFMTAVQGGSPTLGDSLIDRSDRNDEGHKRGFIAVSCAKQFEEPISCIVIQFISFGRPVMHNNTISIIDISLVLQIHCSSPICRY